MKRLTVLLILAGVLGVAAFVSAAPMEGHNFLGQYGRVYDIVWDGWKGELVLQPDPWAANSHLKGADGRRYAVRYQVLLEAQQVVGGTAGPGYTGAPTNMKYRIVFWVDFNNTKITTDDQKFDGYLMTQTKDAIAGVTWWNRMPFGFYAIRKYDVPG